MAREVFVLAVSHDLRRTERVDAAAGRDTTPEGKGLMLSMWPSTVLGLRFPCAIAILLLWCCLVWSLDAPAMGKAEINSVPRNDSGAVTLRHKATFNLSPRDASVVKWSPDSRQVAVGGLFNDGIQIFDIEAKKQVSELKKNRPGSVGLAWGPDGRLIAAAIAGTRNFEDRISVFVWDARTGAHLKSIVGPFEPGNEGENDPESVAFSPDSKFLAVAYAGRLRTGGAHIYIYEISSGRVVDSFGDVKNGFITAPIIFSPNGLTIVEGTNRGDIRIWDIASRALRRAIKAHGFSVSSLTYSPDGKWLASATSTGMTQGRLDQTTGQYVRETNDEQPRIWDAATGKLIKSLSGYTSSVRRGLQFSPDGKYLVSGGFDKTLKVWNTSTWQLAYTALARDGLVSIDVSPNGRYIAAGGGHWLMVWWMER